jgi:hypothetical protein
MLGQGSLMTSAAVKRNYTLWVDSTRREESLTLPSNFALVKELDVEYLPL